MWHWSFPARAIGSSHQCSGIVMPAQAQRGYCCATTPSATGLPGGPSLRRPTAAGREKRGSPQPAGPCRIGVADAPGSPGMAWLATARWCSSATSAPPLGKAPPSLRRRSPSGRSAHRWMLRRADVSVGRVRRVRVPCASLQCPERAPHRTPASRRGSRRVPCAAWWSHLMRLLRGPAGTPSGSVRCASLGCLGGDALGVVCTSPLGRDRAAGSRVARRELSCVFDETHCASRARLVRAPLEAPGLCIAQRLGRDRALA